MAAEEEDEATGAPVGSAPDAAVVSGQSSMSNVKEQSAAGSRTLKGGFAPATGVHFFRSDAMVASSSSSPVTSGNASDMAAALKAADNRRQ